jgi:DNA-binding IclR family transcriptional regulator
MVRVFSLIGKRAPLHATGVGKVILADKPWYEVEEILTKTGLPRITKYTITEMEEMKEELEQIRIKGYAFDNEECELGAFCVAAPIRDYTGNVIASMSVSMPTNRFSVKSKKTMIIEVLKQSMALSKKLGYMPNT